MEDILSFVPTKMKIEEINKSLDQKCEDFWRSQILFDFAIDRKNPEIPNKNWSNEKLTEWSKEVHFIMSRNKISTVHFFKAVISVVEIDNLRDRPQSLLNMIFSTNYDIFDRREFFVSEDFDRREIQILTMKIFWNDSRENFRIRANFDDDRIFERFDSIFLENDDKILLVAKIVGRKIYIENFNATEIEINEVFRLFSERRREIDVKFDSNQKIAIECIEIPDIPNFSNKNFSETDPPILRHYVKIEEMRENLRNLSKSEKVVEKNFEMSRNFQFRGEKLFLVSDDSDYEKSNSIVDFFIEDQRIRAKRYDEKLSAYEIWKSGRIIGNTPKKLHYALYTGTKVPSLFQATKAKFLIEMIFRDDVTGKSWLDISAGWGDRLVASMILKMKYLGFDPNTNLIAGHGNLKQFVARNLGLKSSDYKIIYQEFEKSEKEISENFFDICLSSPPFFGLEIYDSTDQSTDKYKTIESWLNDFLFKSLELVWKYLKVGGYMAINMSDYGGFNIVDKMKEFVSKFELSSYQGEIAFGNSKKMMSSRPEFCFVWKKSPEKSFETPKKQKLLLPLDHINTTPFKIKKFDGINIIDDGEILGGTKARALKQYIMEKIEIRRQIGKETKGILYAGPISGSAQLAVSIVAKQLKIISYLYLSGVTKSLLDYPFFAQAKNYRPISKGFLKLKNARIEAMKYIVQNPKVMLIPFGFGDDIFDQILFETLKITNEKSPIYPKVVWMAVGSGTILKAFAKLFPDIQINVVRIGAHIDLSDILKPERVKIFDAPEKFWEDTRILPPYKSVPSYDAKVWRFVKSHAKDGDFVLNVAKI